MKLALIGYGRMGKTIERIAKERGHTIVYIANGGALDLAQAKLARACFCSSAPINYWKWILHFLAVVA